MILTMLKKMKSYIGKVFDLNAKVISVDSGIILDSNHDAIKDIYCICLKGSLFSYLKFKNSYGKVTTIVKGWPTVFIKK